MALVSKHRFSTAVEPLLNTRLRVCTMSVAPITHVPRSRPANLQGCLANRSRAVCLLRASITTSAPTAQTVSVCRSSAPAIIASSAPIARTKSRHARSIQTAPKPERISNTAAPMATRRFAQLSFRSLESIDPAADSRCAVCRRKVRGLSPNRRCAACRRIAGARLEPCVPVAEGRCVPLSHTYRSPNRRCAVLVARS